MTRGKRARKTSTLEQTKLPPQDTQHEDPGAELVTDLPPPPKVKKLSQTKRLELLEGKNQERDLQIQSIGNKLDSLLAQNKPSSPGAHNVDSNYVGSTGQLFPSATDKPSSAAGSQEQLDAAISASLVDNQGRPKLPFNRPDPVDNGAQAGFQGISKLVSQSDSGGGLLNNIMQECMDESVSMNNEASGEVLLPYLVCGSLVDPKIKAKIWSKEYIELGLLAPKSQNDNSKSQIALGLEDSLVTQFAFSSAKSKKSQNIDEWHRWFSAYASIYVQKYPSEAPAIFTYITRIFSLQRNSPTTFTWRLYDEHFRKIRAFQPIPWHVIHQPVLAEVSEAPKHFQQNNSNNSSNHTSTSRNKPYDKPCFEYNKVSGCADKSCIYTHKCLYCSTKGHPEVKCFKKAKDSSP